MEFKSAKAWKGKRKSANVRREKRRDSNIHSGMLSLSVVLFLIFLVLGSLLGKNERRIEANTDALRAKTLHLDWIQDCIRTELRINEKRKLLDLPPLKTETICGF